MGIYKACQYKEVKIYWTPGPTNLADIFTKEDKDVAHFESVRDQMVMPQESCCLPIKANLKGMLERRLDNSNYESLTKSKKRKDDVLITDTTVNTNTSSDNDTINDNDNNTSNKRIDHGL